MEILRLGGNLLTGDIPSELGNLANLQELYLHVNEWVIGFCVDISYCFLWSISTKEYSLPAVSLTRVYLTGYVHCGRAIFTHSGLIVRLGNLQRRIVTNLVVRNASVTTVSSFPMEGIQTKTTPSKLPNQKTYSKERLYPVETFLELHLP